MKSITINGINFDYKKYKPRRNGKTKLTDLYKNPSLEKEQTFDYRKDELYTIYGLSGNLHRYVIYGVIMDEDMQMKYDVKITKDHNYVLDK